MRKKPHFLDISQQVAKIKQKAYILGCLKAKCPSLRQHHREIKSEPINSIRSRDKPEIRFEIYDFMSVYLTGIFSHLKAVTMGECFPKIKGDPATLFFP